jgi:cyclophilin family peptidyl-prolyl cis-trans isomerase/HEAT repeat protein
MEKKNNHIYVFILSIFIMGCIPVTQEPITKVSLDVADGTFQRIYGYQDEQKLDSLLSFTSDFDPSYRFMVANALASFQSEEGLDSLYKLMYDPVMKVRTAAVYAIGQIGKKSSVSELLKAFKTKDTLDVDNIYNATIIESIGKVGGKNLLPSLATVSTYRITDTLLLIGQSRAIYNYALRGMTTTEGTDKLVQYLTEKDYPDKVKLIAANYLARAKDLDLSIYKNRLMQVLNEDKDVNVRMSVVLALGKTKDLEVLRALRRHFNEEKDYRVKSNIVRSMSNFSYIKVIEPILDLVKHDNLHIANTAANYLITKGNSNDATIYKNYLNDSLHYSVQSKIYSAILKHMPVYYTNTKDKIKKEILAKIEGTSDTYEKAAYLTSLGHDPYNYKDIFEMSASSKSPVIKSTASSAITELITSPNFVSAYKRGQYRVKREIIELMKAEIEQGDVGSLAVYGELFADETLNLKPLIDDVSFLELAQGKLNLPKEIETYNSLGKAISFLTDKQYVAKTPDFNHPIDWSIFSQYGDSVQVAIKTEKGIIRAKMYTQFAPGSVSNFLNLVKDDFYDGKGIHRVVPNFVVQGGCPRGDGYGGLDYTIRSEVPQLYYEDEGYLGMASAGLHTEGTQWFITHSPAMHLNGKYTIFGKVTDGMDVVHDIEVGDKIEDVIITKL